jgi:hypothetical protein
MSGAESGRPERMNIAALTKYCRVLAFEGDDLL